MTNYQVMQNGKIIGVFNSERRAHIFATIRVGFYKGEMETLPDQILKNLLREQNLAESPVSIAAAPIAGKRDERHSRSQDNG